MNMLQFKKITQKKVMVQSTCKTESLSIQYNIQSVLLHMCKMFTWQTSIRRDLRLCPVCQHPPYKHLHTFLVGVLCGSCWSVPQSVSARELCLKIWFKWYEEAKQTLYTSKLQKQELLSVQTWHQIVQYFSSLAPTLVTRQQQSHKLGCCLLPQHPF